MIRCRFFAFRLRREGLLKNRTEFRYPAESGIRYGKYLMMPSFTPGIARYCPHRKDLSRIVIGHRREWLAAVDSGVQESRSIS